MQGRDTLIRQAAVKIAGSGGLYVVFTLTKQYVQHVVIGHCHLELA